MTVTHRVSPKWWRIPVVLGTAIAIGFSLDQHHESTGGGVPNWARAPMVDPVPLDIFVRGAAYAGAFYLIAYLVARWAHPPLKALPKWRAVASFFVGWALVGIYCVTRQQYSEHLPQAELYGVVLGASLLVAIIFPLLEPPPQS